MKIVNELYHKSKDISFLKSQFNEDPDKTNILFVDPVLMNFDFYTMIMPYLALEQSGKIQTATTTLYLYKDMETKPPTVIHEMEVRWADVIVFPMTLEPFGDKDELFSYLRQIKPEIKIIMTCEFDFYSITNDHYLLEEDLIKSYMVRSGHEITAKSIREKRNQMKLKIQNTLTNNYQAVDRILVLNHNLKNKLIAKGYQDVKYVPILLSTDHVLANVDYSETLGTKFAPKLIIISVELNESTRQSFKPFIPVFKNLKDQHGFKCRIIIMGDDPKKYFEDLDFEYEHIGKSSLVHHFKAIVKSSADIHLALNKKSEYSSHSESIYSFVERGLLAIPLVSLNTSPLNEFIHDRKNGYLINTRNDLIKVVEEIIKDKTELINISKEVEKEINQKCQYTFENVETMAEIFSENFIDPSEVIEQ